MILQEARLTVRLHRFELYAFGAAILGLVVAAVIAAAYIQGLRPGPECFTVDDTPSSACQRALDAYFSTQQSIGSVVMSPLLVVVYVVGVFLGVPIVGRELERGTTRLAWSLAPSRWRWLSARVLPMLAILVVLTFAAGVASDRFFAVSTPDVDVSNAFTGFGARGVLLASRAAFIFGLAVLVGAIVGRSLPAVIVTALVATIGLWGGEEIHQRVFLRNEAIPVASEQTGPGDLYIDQRFQLPDGSLVNWDYFNNSDPYDAEGNPIYPIVSIVVPGNRYRFVETREALVLAGGTLATLLISGFVVARRRPG